MVAYLIGFVTVQMEIALLFYAVGCSVVKDSTLNLSISAIPLKLRFTGFTLTGIGMAFLSSAFLG